MKRIFVLMLLAAGLGACKGGAGEAAKATAPAPEVAKAPEAAPAGTAPVEVVVWHSYREGEKLALEKTVEKFNADSKALQIRLLNVPYDAFVDKVTIASPRGQGPDLFIFAHNMIGEWVDHVHLLEPLSDRVPADVLKRFIPSTVRALVYKQSLYGLPLAFKSLALFYNPGIVKNVPASAEALASVAKAATDKAQGRYGLVYEAGLLYFDAPFLQGFGGVILDEKGEPHVADKPMVDALAYLKGLAKAGIIPSGVNSAMVTSLFNEGKAAMVISGPWFVGEIAGTRPFAVAPLPAMPAGPARPFLGSEAVFVSAFSKHKDEAVKVALALTTDEAATVRLQVGRQTVANAAVYERDDVKNDAVVTAFRTQAETASLMPSRPEMQVIWSTMDTAINKAVFGDADPQKALDEAQAKIVADIAKMAK